MCWLQCLQLPAVQEGLRPFVLAPHLAKPPYEFEGLPFVFKRGVLPGGFRRSDEGSPHSQEGVVPFPILIGPDYGYGVAEPSMASSAEGRTAKRRNSKTPAMLLATLQSDLNFEGGRSAGAASPGGLPVKRRRFERRNSKTPTMLLATMQAALELDGCDDEDDDSTMEGSPVPPSTPDSPEGCPLDATEDVADDDDEDDDDDDNWEGGLEIAQELVKQLQRRRRPGLFG